MSNEIDRSLGRLEATADAIKDMVTSLQQDVRQIADDAHSTRSRVEALEKRLAAVEPVIAETANWKQRFIGMGMLVKLFWVIFGALIATGLAWVWQHLPFGRP